VGHELVTTVIKTDRRRTARAFLRNIRSPEWGIAGQGVRFVIAGGLVAGVNVTITLGLHSVFSVQFQIALAVGFVTGVLLHFTLQRVFVWRHYESFALRIHHQVLRYVLVGASQYGVTALSTSALPGLLDLPVEFVYIATMLTVAVVNFLVFRGRVFHSS
jgi:putative flippase GtrA